jgi:hypothetical protein
LYQNLTAAVDRMVHFLRLLLSNGEQCHTNHQSVTMKPKVTFELSLEEANLIFKALGKLPFEEVYELIGKMNEQANHQLKTPKNGIASQSKHAEQ